MWEKAQLYGRTAVSRRWSHHCTSRVRLSTEGFIVPEIPQLLYYITAVSGSAGLLYTSVLFVVALVSVLAPTPERRKDARTTLAILVRRRSR